MIYKRAKGLKESGNELEENPTLCGKKGERADDLGGLALLGGLLGGPGVSVAIGKVGSLVVGALAGGLIATPKKEEPQGY
jgi:hypothetical protein